jgi:hypothetical protein
MTERRTAETSRLASSSRQCRILHPRVYDPVLLWIQAGTFPNRRVRVGSKDESMVPVRATV